MAIVGIDQIYTGNLLATASNLTLGQYKQLGPFFPIPGAPVELTASTTPLTWLPTEGLLALPWADQSRLLGLQNALLNSSGAANASIAATGFGGWVFPADYSSTRDTLEGLGIMPAVTGSCSVITNDTFSDTYGLITCPAGTFLRTRAEVRTSCANSTRPCPVFDPTGAFPTICICSPCAAVPTQQVVVAPYSVASPWGPSSGVGIATAANGTASSTLSACARLAVCLTAYQLDVVTFRVTDAYGPTLRASLGLPLVTSVSFHLDDADDSVATSSPLPATLLSPEAGSVGAVWVVTLPAGRTLGYLQFSVIVNGGTLADGAPTVINSIPPPCAGLLQPTPGGSCTCPAATALSGPLDANCKSIYSIPAVIGGVPGACVLLALVAAAIAQLRFARLARVADTSWLIKSRDISTDMPPQVLGIGTFGLVIRGSFRGSPVALKRSQALTRDSGGQGPQPGPHPPLSVHRDAGRDGAGRNGASPISSFTGAAFDRIVGDGPAPRSSLMPPQDGAASLLAPSVLAYAKRVDVVRATAQQSKHGLTLGGAILPDGSAYSVLASAGVTHLPMDLEIENEAAAVEAAARRLGGLASSGSGEDGAGRTWLRLLSNFKLVTSGPSEGKLSQAERGGSSAASLRGCFGLAGARSPASERVAFINEIRHAVSLRHPRIVTVGHGGMPVVSRMHRLACSFCFAS